MTDDEKREILRQARENVARLNEQFPKCGRKPEAVVERPLQELEAQCAPKLEEPEPVHFVETDAMRARRLQAEHDAASNAWLDARLDERFADERDSMVEIASIAPERARRVIGLASFVTRRGSGEPFVAQWATSLLAMLGRAEVQVELGADDRTHHKQRDSHEMHQ